MARRVRRNPYIPGNRDGRPVFIITDASGKPTGKWAYTEATARRLAGSAGGGAAESRVVGRSTDDEQVERTAASIASAFSKPTSAAPRWVTADPLKDVPGASWSKSDARNALMSSAYIRDGVLNKALRIEDPTPAQEFNDAVVSIIVVEDPEYFNLKYNYKVNYDNSDDATEYLEAKIYKDIDKSLSEYKKSGLKLHRSGPLGLNYFMYGLVDTKKWYRTH